MIRRQAVLHGCAHCLPPCLLEHHRVPEKIRLHRRTGLSALELCTCGGQDQRHCRHPKCLLHPGVANIHFRQRHSSLLRHKPPHSTAKESIVGSTPLFESKETMPVYEFACSTNECPTYEVWRSISDRDTSTECPECGSQGASVQSTDDAHRWIALEDRTKGA